MEPTPTAIPSPTVAPSPISTPTPVVLTGVDVLLRDGLDQLSGKRLGLVTNATGRTRAGRSTIDALFGGWKLTALFSPEHGIRGDAEAGQSVDSSQDPQTGLPVYSLYGSATRPTDSMLSGVQVLVYDIQDVGTRTYTYISTLLEAMRAAAAHKLPLVVLDRPDPISGDHVDGNVLDVHFASFVGPAPIAMRYGMTIGELAQFFNVDSGVSADLSVVQMEGWQRWMWFDQTELAWVNPSPNLRSLSAAALYPGMVLFEGTNVSEGRGTPMPFEWIGAPWLDAAAWAAALEASMGVHLTPVDYVPDPGSAKYPGEVCRGLSIRIDDRANVRPMALAVHMLATLPGVQFNAPTFDGLAGTDRLRKSLHAGVPPDQIVADWKTDLDSFAERRKRFLLY
jgi:uncharacterized protein YbbC (DUF1343 family)